jgi:DNA-binding NarL/FixJ family response regulator
MIGKLTPRQREVLELAANGLTDEQAATVLGLGLETVKHHKKVLLRNLDAYNTPHAVALALKYGLLSTTNVIGVTQRSAPR